MPLIYEGECTNCGFRSASTPIAFDGVYVGVLAADDNTHAHPDDRRFVVLGHPLEAEILHETGYTDKSATFEGRYVIFKCYFCKSCGQQFEVRRLGSSATLGCVPAIALGIGSAIGVGIWKSSCLLGALAAYFGLVGGYVLIQMGIRGFVRLTHARHAAAIDTERRCPKSRSRRAASPSSRWRRLPCPRCRQRRLRVNVVGIS